MKARVASVRVLRTVLGLASLSVVAGAGQAFAASPVAPSFDLVIKAPDDPELNLAYARAEANAGNLLNAAAALERVLLTRPNAYAVRLFYAAVLYRLDDLQGAKEQLRLLADAPLTPLQAAERAKYSRLVASAQKTTQVSGQLAAGVDYQSDAAGALRAQFDVPGAHPRQLGGAALVSGKLAATVKLRPSLDVYATVDGYSRSDVSGPKNDLQSVAIQLGLARKNLTTSWKLGGVGRHYALFNNPYLTEFGGQAEASWRPNTATTVMGRFEAVRQTYHEPFIDALARAGTLNGTHDGWRYNASLGLAYRLSARSTIGAAAGYEWKTAGYKPFGYDAPYVSANYHGLLGRGIYIDLLGRIMFPRYRAADPVFLGPGVDRKSRLSDVRLVLGVPLSAFAQGGATGDELENFTLEAAVGYTHRSERAPLADYESFGGSVNLIWRFGDGT